MARRIAEIFALLTALVLAGVFQTAAQTNGPAGHSASNNPAALHPDSRIASGVGSWIWDAQTFDQQTCRFWRAFEVPAGTAVKQARLRVTADNSFILWIDGRELGRGGEWRTLSEYDVRSVLGPGTHVLAVEAFND